MYKKHFDKSLLLEGNDYLYAYNNNDESTILVLWITSYLSSNCYFLVQSRDIYLFIKQIMIFSPKQVFWVLKYLGIDVKVYKLHSIKQ